VRGGQPGPLLAQEFRLGLGGREAGIRLEQLILQPADASHQQLPLHVRGDQPRPRLEVLELLLNLGQLRLVPRRLFPQELGGPRVAAQLHVPFQVVVQQF